MRSLLESEVSPASHAAIFSSCLPRGVVYRSEMPLKGTVSKADASAEEVRVTPPLSGSVHSVRLCAAAAIGCNKWMQLIKISLGGLRPLRRRNAIIFSKSGLGGVFSLVVSV